jgi:NAD(P)-dependent dehydrogenase (short-subunit alcohol dehydrogenase family)
MEKLLAGKVALITGGGRGMGWAMARAFAEAGAKGVTIVSSSSPDEIAKGAEEIDRIAGRDAGLGMVADVRDDAACGEAVARTVEKFGALHILVNNAGLGMKNAVDGARGPFWEARPDGWDKVIGVNVNGPFHMARHAARHLIEAGWGRVINVSKTADSMHETRNSPYGPSKAALEAMTLCWAQDFLDTGVTANLILPGGLTATTFSRPSAVKRARETGKPVFEAEDIAPLAVALASEAADRYSGCRFNARGWRTGLPLAEALEGCRTMAVFPKPRRKRELMTPWDALQDERVI